MDSRRNFIGKVASGLATTIASPAAVLSANDRIRLGVIGAGDRGQQLVREALSLPNAEIVAFADVYSKRLEEAKRLAPDAETHTDYRRMLDDKSLDAVLIATPHHLHCEHFVEALRAGKHVYQEKTMAFTVEHAKRMRAAYLEAVQSSNGRVVQIGHQSCSSGHVSDAAAFLSGNKVGRATALRMQMFRNTPQGKPQWARPVHADMNEQRIDWNSFLGETGRREFDANRYQNWRFFTDYSGGNVHENMCHQLAFWYKLLDLQIPVAATMTGGIYLWKDGREVPDTMSVTLEQPEELLVTWQSGFGNNSPGVGEDLLGTNGTISRTQQIRYFPQKVNRPDGVEVSGHSKTLPAAHMLNFFEGIRFGKQQNCPFDLGYRVSIATRMALESYREQRTVRWDAENEAIV